MHNSYTRAVVGRYSPHPRVLTLLLLVLLCCTAGCLAASHHRCMHDQMAQGSEQMAVVREIPRKGQGAVQAYAASAATTEEPWQCRPTQRGAKVQYFVLSEEAKSQRRFSSGRTVGP
ncbi:uncharacterized protein TM35_001171050 [Trypanosoma theileri]|uniref:Leishmanolysin-like peptidase n=1 Tax=Trypanosoma theileri TaxID=67003 RepID=A0A1X0NF92_9TRYP|nr:uncharacterized protein TM35_001171050 [Trypanosoma theileri]ORC81423.1 hypothetical protein TM35_001171050 [Trypanosoma theileri]